MRVGFAVALGVLVYAVLLRVIRPTLWSSVLPPLLWAAAIGALAHTARRRYAEPEAEQPPVGVQAAWMASQVMLRGLSVVYVCAFYSTAPQLLPLVGSDGLTPWAARVHGWSLLALFPSDAAIWLCGHAGLLLALVALVPPCCYIRSWHRAAAVDAVLFAALALLYTSAHLVLGKWQSHHADYITTQLGPATACLAIAWAAVPQEPRYAARVVALWRWQLFCIMLNCGIVKMNANWVECNQSLCDVPACPRFWYSQERPTILGWLLAALLPDTLQRVFSWFTMWCELAMPFGYFVPSLWPICAAGTAALQVGIIMAGHFNWFNLVCLVLTLSLVPPEILATAAYRLGLPGIDARVPLQRDAAAAAAAASSGTLSRGATLGVALYVAAVYFASACLLVGRMLATEVVDEVPEIPGFGWASAFARWMHSARLANPYGVFSKTMTDHRLIVYEGLDAAGAWREYEYYLLPGRTDHINLNWPFLPLGNTYDVRFEIPMHYASYGAGLPAWGFEIARRLLRNDASITWLFGRNPFAGRAAPRAIAATAYLYTPTLDLRAVLGRAPPQYWNRTLLWRKVIAPSGFRDENECVAHGVRDAKRRVCTADDVARAAGWSAARHGSPPTLPGGGLGGAFALVALAATLAFHIGQTAWPSVLAYLYTGDCTVKSCQ